MGFLSILAAWLLLRWRGPATPLQRDGWLPVWYRRAGALFSWLPVGVRPLLICALPALLVAAIAWLIAPLLGGALLFAFGLWILLYSLGRGDMQAQLDAYLERWSRGDLEAAYRAAEQAIDIDGDVTIENAITLHARVRRALLYTALERWFAVVFWFYFLGPAGALFYRCVRWYTRTGSGSSEEQSALARYLYWLEWLPTRFLGLAFAITGNFAGCMHVWRERLTERGGSADLLDACAEQALSGGATKADDAHFAERAVAELRELGALLARSSVGWLVVFALLQMAR